MNTMESSSSSSLSNNSNNSTKYSELMVSNIIQNGIQSMIVQTTTGIIFGTLLGIVLVSRGPTNSILGKRIYYYSGLGGGIGLGNSYTNTSIQIEQLLLSSTTVIQNNNKK